MKAIIIATTKDRSDWAKQCYDSLKGYTRYPVIILDQYQYELGKIWWVIENTTIDEFLFLQDSIVLKSTDWLDDVFDFEGSVSLAERPFFMYLGKYQRSRLEKVGIPEVSSKKEAVDYEASWTKRYSESGDYETLFDLKDTNVFEERLGRRNMVIENDKLIKYKHIWNGDMVYDY